MVIRKLKSIIILLAVVLISACGSWKYGFEKIYLSGKPQRLIKKNSSNFVSNIFDVSNSGNIYFSYTKNGRLSIFKLEIESGNIEEIISTEQINFSPIVSSDESKIIYYGGDDFNNISLYLYDVEKKKNKLLFISKLINPLKISFSKDTNRIYYISNPLYKELNDSKFFFNDCYELFSFDLTDFKHKRITNFYFQNISDYFVIDNETILLMLSEGYISEKDWESALK